jgi:hypothetical protein
MRRIFHTDRAASFNRETHRMYVGRFRARSRAPDRVSRPLAALNFSPRDGICLLRPEKGHDAVRDALRDLVAMR